jgi:hypothetical protein
MTNSMIIFWDKKTNTPPLQGMNWHLVAVGWHICAMVKPDFHHLAVFCSWQTEI